MDATQPSLLNDVIIVTSILFGLGVLYFFFLARNQKKSISPAEILSTSKTLNTYEDKSVKTPEKTEEPSHDLHSHIEKKVEESIESKEITAERHLPYTTREPFEETPGITVDDFYNFKGAYHNQ